MERQRSETKALIKTEYRNEISKDLTKYAPSFKKKISKMLQNKYEDGLKAREEKQKAKVRSTSY